jgi:predicted solute-binding protein
LKINPKPKTQKYYMKCYYENETKNYYNVKHFNNVLHCGMCSKESSS